MRFRGHMHAKKKWLTRGGIPIKIREKRGSRELLLTKTALSSIGIVNIVFIVSTIT